ncbi:MAG: (Fe-S)-binding protein [Candidatus Lambdaproteobacteria bacterium]|nr:(Fe-S)-binding protein [Candidatus Lambdaproteobacteria bacterium]
MTAIDLLLPAEPKAPGTSHLAQAWRNATSHCIKCGFCLPVCPTYSVLGVEAASPRGRLDLMDAVAQGRLALGTVAGRVGQCLGCLACETACPAGIRYGQMFEALQCDMGTQRRGWRRWRARLLLDGVLARPRVLRAVVLALRVYQRSGLQRLLRSSGLLRLLGLAGREGRLPPLPRPLAWRAEVEFGAPPGTDATTTGGAQRAALFTGCVMDAAFGAVHAATAHVLAANGVQCALPAGQRCCGALHAHAGETASARRLARANIAAFETVGDAPVVLNSAGCGAFMKRYGTLLADDPAWAPRAAALAARVRDVSEFLAVRTLVPPTRAVALRVAYDDPCHLVHAQGISREPRDLLRAIPGLTLVELPESTWCCGSAGSYSLQHPELAGDVLARKMRHLAAARVDVVATGNPGCLLQLALGISRQGLDVDVRHPIELLAQAYP